MMSPHVNYALCMYLMEEREKWTEHAANRPSRLRSLFRFSGSILVRAGQWLQSRSQSTEIAEVQKSNDCVVVQNQ